MKILALDIETAPAVVYTWGLFDQRTGLEQIISQPRMLCFAAKWIGRKGITFRSEYHHSTQEMVENHDGIWQWGHGRYVCSHA